MVKDFEVSKGDIDNAISMMKEVAQWCEDTEKNMWKINDLSKDILIKGLTAENFCIGKVKNENVATMILQWHDTLFWPQIKENESGFIHKLCVRRMYSGKGLAQEMIAYAIQECQRKQIGYLRLDTGWDRPKLCQLYESLGFVKVAKKTIGTLDYALYEMKIS
jgi:GNAT superfamily N-acetyltransferase